jgi:hypothetical protein
MGHLYPEAVKASHINMIVSLPPKPLAAPIPFLTLVVKYALGWWTPEEKKGFERTMWWQKKSQGYYLQQSTNPQTLGYSLTDSPVGLLAWIYEKLVLWSDEYEWTDEEICTWISIYWFSTATPAGNLRIYYESVGRGEWDVGEGSKKGPGDTSTIPMVSISLLRSHNRRHYANRVT